MSRAFHDQRPAELSVALAELHSTHDVDCTQLVDAVKCVIKDSNFTSAAISLAIVDDVTIHELNRRYLNHDWPTDVLSFVLDNRDGHLEGEIVISADTAAAAAAEVGWPAAAEQLLYVIHGALHLVGHDDKTATGAEEMRTAEERYLRRFGFAQPGPASNSNNATSAVLAGNTNEGQVAP